MEITNRNLKEYLKRLVRSTIFWTIAMLLFSIFRYFALKNEIGISIDPNYEGFYQLKDSLLNFALGGFLIGILYANIEFLIDKFIAQRSALVLIILFEILLTFTAIITVSNLVLSWWVKNKNIPYVVEPGWWYKDSSFIPALIYIGISIVIYSLITIVFEKFGRGVFFKMLIGSYKQPQETKRIFMFLDLTSSTTIAERLGHQKYSQFIQDFFYDLNEIAAPYEAEIYQYIGDEAVLSWSYKKGVYKNNCLNLFYAFKKKIASKSKFYLDKYDIIPEFKAGIHGGSLMVAEVGVVKKELAYHGDVINTTARVQAKCNDYRVSILTTKSLLNNLDIEGRFIASIVAKVVLKGKEKPVQLYTLTII
ncbi:adenylate/guanylate cyclase domain-containing protein [uncultured Aquimarina sp.]|uniref:adenylate/guanylate cyclase domain-containing protein n=1 Tax=uncultured Aquimarina sp. TaxID=575652 RepID=UPI002639E5E4|nr:adenylate/guanylate cyclase domain-containing protein [uncultured Aquimarina sp.]